MEKKTIKIPVPAKGSTPIILVGLLLVAVFFVGRLSGQVELLKKGQGTTFLKNQDQPSLSQEGGTQQPSVDSSNQQQIAVVPVSLDDDPFLGEEDAPVVMIEFSDFECPFCKRFWEQTLPQLKTNYIDTGKLKYVYRDLPLPIHDPLATQEALAANCARDQKGDEVFFKYHDEIFSRTKSNGNGMPKDELYKIAADLNLNANQFKECLDSEKFKAEVQKDMTDAQTVGAAGTPTLLIGRSTKDGTIQGERIIGAQPYEVFQPVIEKYLN